MDSEKEIEPILVDPDWVTYVDSLGRKPAAEKRRNDEARPVAGGEEAPAHETEPVSWADYVDQLSRRLGT